MKKQINLRPLLRKAGMKVTPGHLAILSIIAKSKKPLSTQDIIESIGPELDPATVYRCMSKLKKSGLVRQIDLRQNHAHFEFFDMEHHHHIVCTQCGTIEDVAHCNLEPIHEEILRGSKKFYKIQHHSLEFYGVCKECAG